MTTMEIGLHVIEHADGRLKEMCLREGIPLLKNYSDSPVTLAEDVNHDKADELAKYVREGGIVLCNRRDAAFILKKRIPFLSGATIFHADYSNQHKRIWPFRVQTSFQPQYIETTPIGDGQVISFPFHISKNLSDLSYRRMIYPSPVGYPIELAPGVGKGEIRRLIVNYIQVAFLQKGLPFIRLRHGPGSAPNWYAFRVDVDGGHPYELRKIWEIAQASNLSISFYIHVEPNLREISLLREMADQGQDIQLHCYDHHTYLDPALDFENMNRGANILREAGFNITGVVAPYGLWNFELSKIFEKVGLTYSSEFCFSINDLPSYPKKERETNAVLQIPIEPLCLGMLLKSGLPEEVLGFIFTWCAKQHQKIAEPIFMYGHPGQNRMDGHPTIFSNLFREFEIAGYRKINLTEYAHWWRQREKTELKVLWNGSHVQIKVKKPAPEQFVEFFLPDGTIRISEAHDSKVDVATLPTLVDETGHLEHGNVGKWLPIFYTDIKTRKNHIIKKIKRTIKLHNFLI
ncbi:MAG: hypothetical protein ACE5JB_07600 [bacterium]